MSFKHKMHTWKFINISVAENKTNIKFFTTYKKQRHLMMMMSYENEKDQNVKKQNSL